MVNSFIFEAGTKYLSAFSSYSVSPLSASTMSSPHSPLLAGVAPSNASTRAANLAMAFLEATLCFFAPQHADAAFAFDCARSGGTPVPRVHQALATVTAAHRCRIFSMLIFHSRLSRSLKKYSRKATQSVAGASQFTEQTPLRGPFPSPQVAPSLRAPYDGSSPEDYDEVNSD